MHRMDNIFLSETAPEIDDRSVVSGRKIVQKE